MTSLKQTIAPVAALLTSVAILLMGSGLQGTLLPVRANMEAYSDIEIGILGSAYYVGFTIGCLAVRHLISGVGHIRTYLALVSIASAIALLHAMLVSPVAWWILRAGTGFCFAGLYIVIESWLNERADNASRGTIFSIYTMINLTVITVGQMMLVLADPRAFSLFAVVAILISLASVPVALTRAQSPEPLPMVRTDLPGLFALSPVGFVSCLGHGLTSGSFWALGPVFVMHIKPDLMSVSLFMSATVLGGAVGQFPLGRLSDRIDRRIVIIALCVAAALAALALTGLNDRSLWQLCAFGFCYGVFAFPLYAVSVAHTNDYAAPSAFVATSSGLMLVFGIGCAIGPVFASLIEVVTSTQSLFLFTAGIHAALALFTLSRMTARAPVADAEKVEFKDALVAARTIAPIEIKEDEGGAVGPSTAQKTVG